MNVVDTFHRLPAEFTLMYFSRIFRQSSTFCWEPGAPSAGSTLGIGRREVRNTVASSSLAGILSVLRLVYLPTHHAFSRPLYIRTL